MRITVFLVFFFAVTQAGADTYPIVDTAQTQAFGPHAGQDAHYAGNAPSYEDHGDGTVTDHVTGLMWTKDPGKKMTWANAAKSAKTCRTAGYHDWRLPTIKELYSLIQFNGIDPDPMSTATGNLTPFIDHTVFNFSYGNPDQNERIIDSQFATSTLYVSTTMNGARTMFGVNFADGRIKGYPIGKHGPRGEKTYYALYVRDNPDYGKNNFKDNGDGTITDTATGLTWMKADSGKGMDWQAALKYAESLKLAGHSDWRLPSAKELQSIVDYTRSPDTTGSAAIDPIFDTTAIRNEGGKKDYAHYWTSSTHISAKGRTDTAVYFAFGRSLGWMENRRTGQKTLMDVHGAGSQRSDPKTGDASRFPYGRGPQGDVIRINNMVRCVRGGDVLPVTPSTSKSNASSNPDPTPNQPPRDRPGGNHFLDHFDTNNDGQVTKREFKGPDHHFKSIDKNNDGIISREEADAAPPPPDRRREHRSR